jgi:hypothetical protein
MEHMGTQHKALWPRVEALLKCAHELATSAEDSTTEVPRATCPPPAHNKSQELT